MKYRELQRWPKSSLQRDAKKHTLKQTWKVLVFIMRRHSTAGHPRGQLAWMGKKKILNPTAEAEKQKESLSGG